MSTVSLDARIFDSGNYRTPPIAPPRKKRSTLKKGSTLPTNFDGEVRNGFKDVFSGGATRTLAYDDIEYIDREESAVQTRASLEHDERQGSLERKLKVGNKKTDKFFGESLSDHLSDEPVPSPDDSNKSDSSKDETDRKSVSSDKKLFFLMNMLDREHEEEFKYFNREPVEEPLFVAKKKEIKRHICDDDDYMHEHFHKHEKSPAEHEHDAEDHEHEHHAVAPPKPDRDFSKYQNSAEATTKPTTEAIHKSTTEATTKPTTEATTEAIHKSTTKVITEATHSPTIEAVKEVFAESHMREKLAESHSKARVNRAISRENLPTPPEAPKRKTGAFTISSPVGTPTITIDSIDFHPTPERPTSLTLPNSEDNALVDDSNDPPPPTTPILAHDLVDRMIKKAYGFHDYHPEDITEHNHEDGSSLVAPKSKLTTRKVSLTRKISTNSQPSIEDELLTPEERQKKVSTASMDSSDTSLKSPKKGRDFEKMLQASSINDIIDEIYSKNSAIMQEFQSYLEKSVESKPVINVDAEKEFLKVNGITDNEFSRTPEPVKLPDVETEEVEDAQSYSDSFESTDTEQETITEMKHVASIPKYLGRRRESIEDVDNWFTRHLDGEATRSQTYGVQDNAPPSVSNYDTEKIFPFGRTIVGRRDSMSDEFFSQSPQQISMLKPEIGTLRESESSVSDDGEREAETTPTKHENSPTSKREEFREKSPDHSSLLKFLEQESKVN